jgi:hypothetical protein
MRFQRRILIKTPGGGEVIVEIARAHGVSFAHGRLLN